MMLYITCNVSAVSDIGTPDTLLAVHLARTTIEPLQHVSDKYRPTGRDQHALQEDLATLGSVQLKHTLALRTLASRLPGERPLLETNGDILWTQQRSSGVRSERKKKEDTILTMSIDRVQSGRLYPETRL